MAVIFRPSFASATGWTEFNAGGAIGTITFNFNFDGQTGVELNKTSSSGWDNFGIQRQWPSTGVGYVCYFDWFFRGNGIDCLYVLNDATGLAVSSCVGIYAAGGGGVFLIYNGATSSSNPPMVQGRYIARLIVESDGNITFDWKAPGGVSWNSVGTSTGINYSTGNVFQQINLHTDTTALGPALPKMANLFLTDDGDFTPQTPTIGTATPTGQTSIDIDWTDVATSTSADGISIERSLTSGSGFVEIDTVAIGVETFSDSGLTAGTAYFYRVRSFITWDGDVYYSTYSSEASATTDAAPVASGGNAENMLALGEL